jgi:hypothetical protein
LNAAGIEPAPHRSDPTWREFLSSQAEAIIAADLFHVDTALGTRLYALAFLEHGTRRLHITGATTRPTQDWTVQQARNLSADLGTRMESLRFLLCDRDDKYGEAFDTVFEAEELRVIKSAPQAPRMNARCERIIGTLRREVLDHILITGEAHARHVLAAHEIHYNTHRPHQARDQLPPEAQEQPAATHDLKPRKLLRRSTVFSCRSTRSSVSFSVSPRSSTTWRTATSKSPCTAETRSPEHAVSRGEMRCHAAVTTLRAAQG